MLFLYNFYYCFFAIYFLLFFNCFTIFTLVFVCFPQFLHDFFGHYDSRFASGCSSINHSSYTKIFQFCIVASRLHFLSIPQDISTEIHTLNSVWWIVYFRTPFIHSISQWNIRIGVLTYLQFDRCKLSNFEIWEYSSRMRFCKAFYHRRYSGPTGHAMFHDFQQYKILAIS